MVTKEPRRKKTKEVLLKFQEDLDTFSPTISKMSSHISCDYFDNTEAH